jgi:predicted amidohydrolase YtcJ
MSRFDLVLRQALLPDGRIADVGIANGQIAAIAPALPRSDNDMDAAARHLLPGLQDHHVHLLATAARLRSVDLSGITDPAIIAEQLNRAAPDAQGWVRATGYDERSAGLPDRHLLDSWVSGRPLRLQDRTGALWVLNSAALDQMGGPPWPEAVETGADGLPTGRLWRGDDWLRSRINASPPGLAPLSQMLARWGVTAVTDASMHNGPGEAALFAKAVQSGELVQQLTLMGRPDLPDDPAYRTGPVKLLLDERSLTGIDDMLALVRAARTKGRAVAAHCVTEAELVTFLAALEASGGAQAGDRIEHGSLIPQSLIADIVAAGLMIVANPGFVAGRGDRYLAEIDPEDLPNLHRLCSLRMAGVPLRAGSDAPYGPPNPWIAIRAAVQRRTASGAALGLDEAIDASAALCLFAGDGMIKEGAGADFCLVDRDWQARLMQEADPDPVMLTMIAGRPAYSRGR